MIKKIVLSSVFISLLSAATYPLYFIGNHHVKSDKLYTALGIKNPPFYLFWKKKSFIDTKTLPLIKSKLIDFYKLEGFYHCKVKDSIKNRSIILYIKEGRPIIIKTISVISKQNIKKFIPFKIGSIFSAKKFEKSKKEIKRYYNDKGYCLVDLTAKAWIDIVRNEAYLTYEIKPNSICKFGNTKIDTPKDIDKNILKSFLDFKKGDKYSLQKINNTYKNLYAREGISSVIIKPIKKDNAVVDIKIKVEENKKPLYLQTGVGINSDEGVEAIFGIKDRNFKGDLKTLGLFAKYTDLEKSTSINFDMPLYHKKIFGAQSKYSIEIYPGFKEKKFLQTLFLKYRNRPNILQGDIIIDTSKIYDSNDLQAYKEGNFLLTSVKLSYIKDTRDNILEPTKGYFAKGTLLGSLKSSISDASYYKYEVEGGYILPFLPYIAAFKLHYGSLHKITGDIPASYRFYAGGMDSNRAYTYRDLGPKDRDGNPAGVDSVFEMTVEYRFPIKGKFGGVIFSDNSYISQKSTPDFSKCYNSLGFGLRYKTPIGALAFDMGFDVSHPSRQHAFHFRIGEQF